MFFETVYLPGINSHRIDVMNFAQIFTFIVFVIYHRPWQEQKIKAETGCGVLQKRTARPSPPARGSGGTLETPHQCLGWSPGCKHVFGHEKAPKCMYWV